MQILKRGRAVNAANGHVRALWEITYWAKRCGIHPRLTGKNQIVERVKGLEPSTSTLGRSRSTN